MNAGLCQIGILMHFVNDADFTCDLSYCNGHIYNKYFRYIMVIIITCHTKVFK